jgi:hypothetical protein
MFNKKLYAVHNSDFPVWINWSNTLLKYMNIKYVHIKSQVCKNKTKLWNKYYSNLEIKDRKYK